MYRAVDDGDQHCGVACGDDRGRNCASGRSGSDRIDEHLAQHTRGLHVREWTLAHGHRYRLHHRSSLLSAPSSSGRYIYIHSFLPACTASSFIILVARCTHRIFDERQKSMEKKILQTLLWFATFLLHFFHALFSRLLEKLQGFLTKIFSDIARASLKPELR